MVRRLLNTALTIMEASEDCRADIALAVSEACANAVRHAHEATEYQVIVTTSHDRCVVEVIDNGVGLDRRHVDSAGLDDAPGRSQIAAAGCG
jgi:serine/threonine-protein kinase RsbW